MFDLGKIQNALSEGGVSEVSWANDLILMNDSSIAQERMYAHRMIGDIFLNPKLNDKKADSNILSDFGMGALSMSVQERRRIETATVVEVSDED